MKQRKTAGDLLREQMDSYQLAQELMESIEVRRKEILVEAGKVFNDKDCFAPLKIEKINTLKKAFEHNRKMHYGIVCQTKKKANSEVTRVMNEYDLNFMVQ